MCVCVCVWLCLQVSCISDIIMKQCFENNYCVLLSILYSLIGVVSHWRRDPTDHSPWSLDQQTLAQTINRSIGWWHRTIGHLSIGARLQYEHGARPLFYLFNLNFFNYFYQHFVTDCSLHFRAITYYNKDAGWINDKTELPTGLARIYAAIQMIL